MKSVKEQIKDWYNHTFFEQDAEGNFVQVKSAVKLGITIESEQGIIDLPIAIAGTQDQLQDIIHGICNKLDKGITPEYYPLAPEGEAKKEAESAAKEEEPELKTIIYRKKQYEVKQYKKKGKEEYLIIRQEDGKVIGPEMKTHQHVINLYLQLVS